MSSFRNFKVSLIAIAVSHSISVSNANAQLLFEIPDGQFFSLTAAADGSNGDSCTFCVGSADSGDDGDSGSQIFSVSGDISTTADIEAANFPAVGLFGSGGDGGNGGFSTGTGKIGGDGGGFFQELFLDGDLTISLSDELGLSNALELAVEGGDGGNGGSGGTGSAGSGANGASAVQEFSTEGFALDITIGDTTADAGVYFLNQGGDGGNGGNSDDASAGHGGDGGSGGETIIVIDDGNISTQNDATHGIYALSAGGDGGDGGDGEVFGDGGDGGSGGAGGTVVLDVNATISTQGDYAHGIIASSIGGQGGEGGDGGIAFDQSGAGGDVVDSNDITIDVDGDIQTFGAGSNGIIAQNIAGYAGDAGNDGGFVSFSSDGGSGADAGGVSIDNTASITTVSDEAVAIQAQSIGGGGGNGGTSFGLFYAEGGSGSNGGDGGEVNITNLGALATSGSDAQGILAQSIGGSGGNGSITVGGLAALGGGGAEASDGGLVRITNSGGIITGSSSPTDTIESGDNPVCGTGCSQGILGQSIGGGGGNAGFTGGFTSVGGDSGGGGNGGDVVLDQSGLIITVLDASSGVMLQSIGGGGGSAAGTEGTIAIGGSGGDGGDGGEVIVEDFAGIVLTEGDSSSAVVLQSIGGGGGSGSATTAVGVEFSVAIGGSGGGGGNGGTVSFTDNNDGVSESLETFGDNSIGLFAQSVGGGGGNGGSATSVSAGIGIDVSLGVSGDGAGGGDGGIISVNTSTTIGSQGEHSTGLFAQSIGGGGGNSGNTFAGTASTGTDITLAIGGSAGDGGDGGRVLVEYDGNLDALGDQSFGIAALSQGGGGGNAGYSIAGSAVSISSVDVSVGGSGGGGGDGGEVVVTLGEDANVATSGASSDAVFAQSLGGGGGNAGVTTSASVVSSVSADISVGGDGGGAGDSDDVTVTSEAETIETTGESSVGIFAQSVGGSGGNSGVTASSEIASGGDFSLAVGGNGGGSGDAGEVTISSTGSIRTEGSNSQGILAQSVASSGGNAGLVLSGDAVDIGDVSIAVGGSGGSGGVAGNVDIDNSGAVTTLGDNSSAIAAQSIGGGGGSSLGSISTTGLSMGDLSVSIGGDGGDSGEAGTIVIDNSGALTTTGVMSHGITGQSIGGGGGNGGYAVNASLTVGEYSGSANATIGGDGGSGGQGDSVNITNQGSISTEDFSSYGVLAQSLGGSGGSGGAVYSATLSASSTASADFSVTIGGDGGDGGQAGDVSIVNEDNVATAGYYSVGLFAQTVGGSGGVGGNSYTFIGDVSAGDSGNMAITVGGDGGEGAVAGNATITNSEDSFISTAKGGATGIFAQSIGGSGGNAGSAGSIIVSLNTGTDGTFQANADIAVGGTGGSGADAGISEVINNGSILTLGDVASGIYAQSVGGGGGNGGAASAFTLASARSVATDDDSDSSEDDPENVSVSFDFSLGGSGGSAGDGNDVIVANGSDAEIETTGLTSYGIFAQSVGGGGGNGGDGALGTEVWTSDDTSSSVDDATSEGISLVSGAVSVATFDPSSLLSNYSFAIGGSGGASGMGGDILVDNFGVITTAGSSATAIFAQTVGGGGGSGGDGAGGLTTTATVSGTGSGGGDGGNINVIHGDTIDANGGIVTSGLGAMGIFAQSVGGGGGTAGDVERAFEGDVLDLNIGISPFAIQSASGEGGDGGDIIISTENSILTTGDYAHGIWAQSVGGGGGASGAVDGVGDYITLVGSGFDSGDGGDISVELGGDIDVSGLATVAVFLQSVSGAESGSSGDVSATITGDISVSGDGSRAILAQTQGTDSSGDINILIDEGATVSASGDAFETIALLNGNNNTITNNGIIESSDVDAYAVFTSQGTTSIDNAGTFSGSVFLDASSATSDYSFTNQESATLASGTSFNLGVASNVDGSLINNGVWSPAGVGVIGSTELIGSSVRQSSTGVYAPDLLLTTTPEADFLVLDVDSANFEGIVSPNVIDVAATNFVLSGTVDLIQSEAGTVDFSELTVEDSVTVDYSLESSTDSSGNDIVSLSYDVEFGGTSAVASLDRDALSETANYIENYLTDVSIGITGNDDFKDDILISVLNTTSIDDLEDLYDSFSNDEVSALSSSLSSLAAEFNNVFFSCPDSNSASRTNSSTQMNFNKQGECSWAKYTQTSIEQESHRGRSAYDGDHKGIATGIQWKLNDDGLYAGVGLSYDEIEQDGNSFTTDGYRFAVGGILKKEYGDTTIAITGHTGFYRHDVNRFLTRIGDDAVAESNPSGITLAGEARVWHTIYRDRQFIKPYLGLHLNNNWQDSYTETGTTNFNLDVDSSSHFTAELRPGIEFGTQFGKANSGSELFVRVGVNILLAGDEITTRSRFAIASTDSPLLEVNSEVDSYTGELSIGTNLVLSKNLTVSLNADVKKSAYTETYGGGIKFRHSF